MRVANAILSARRPLGDLGEDVDMVRGKRNESSNVMALTRVTEDTPTLSRECLRVDTLVGHFLELRGTGQDRAGHPAAGVGESEETGCLFYGAHALIASITMTMIPKDSRYQPHIETETMGQQHPILHPCGAIRRMSNRIMERGD